MARQRETDTPPSTSDRDALIRAFGGHALAVDASLPPIAFGLGWFPGGSIAIGSAAAVGVAAVLAVWRLRRGARPRAVLVSLLAVMLGAAVALHTGNAADFVLIRLVSNAASALAWMVSIAVRWPFLGLIVGTVLTRGKRWRQDPAMLRAYNRASWVWVGQYVARVAVFVPLWAFDAAFALFAAQAVMMWPLVALCVVVSLWVLRRSLPDDHPGIRHPVVR